MRIDEKIEKYLIEAKTEELYCPKCEDMYTVPKGAKKCPECGGKLRKPDTKGSGSETGHIRAAMAK